MSVSGLPNANAPVSGLPNVNASVQDLPNSNSSVLDITDSSSQPVYLDGKIPCEQCGLRFKKRGLTTHLKHSKVVRHDPKVSNLQQSEDGSRRLSVSLQMSLEKYQIRVHWLIISICQPYFF